ncbi:odorant receptor 131-2-like [Genypterus blacodes]|uniref:odorant receptor 131-2-like n=1 Tax=Genypterus blacodes TaxID=154954 RepID=UPI003F76E9C4
MNSSGRQDDMSSALAKNLISFVFAVIMNAINGTFVYTYFKSQVFQRDPRYLLYIHLVINDMLMITLSVTLQILTYTVPLHLASCCIFLLFVVTINKNSPLNLAGMALERYIAVCHPLHHTQICTMQRAYTMIAVMWLLSSLPSLVDIFIVVATQPPSDFSNTLLCYHSNAFRTPYHKTQSVVVQVLLLSIVISVVFITYLKVFFVARLSSGTNQASARNVRNTIMLHGVQLFLSMITFLTPFINIVLLYAWPNHRTKILFVSFLLTNLLPRLLSPLIYGVRDKKFREHLRMNFCKSYNCVNKRVNLSLGAQRKTKLASL